MELMTGHWFGSILKVTDLEIPSLRDGMEN